MTNLTLSEDFTAIWSLKEYLEAELAEISIKHGWPKTSEKLDLPTISLLQAGESEIRNHNPRQINFVPVDGEAVQVKARYITGAIELKIEAHIWDSSKSRLGAAFTAFKDAINKSQSVDIYNPKGLELELAGYYGTLARYDILRYNYINGESESQRSEYRMKVTLSCHFDEIKEVTTSKMIEQQISGEISPTVNLGE